MTALRPLNAPGVFSFDPSSSTWDDVVRLTEASNRVTRVVLGGSGDPLPYAPKDRLDAESANTHAITMGAMGELARRNIPFSILTSGVLPEVAALFEDAATNEDAHSCIVLRDRLADLSQLTKVRSLGQMSWFGISLGNRIDLSVQNKAIAPWGIAPVMESAASLRHLHDADYLTYLRIESPTYHYPPIGERPTQVIPPPDAELWDDDPYANSDRSLYALASLLSLFDFVDHIEFAYDAESVGLPMGDAIRMVKSWCSRTDKTLHVDRGRR